VRKKGGNFAGGRVFQENGRMETLGVGERGYAAVCRAPKVKSTPNVSFEGLRVASNDLAGVFRKTKKRKYLCKQGGNCSEKAERG